jgi:hypothetical protein
MADRDDQPALGTAGDFYSRPAPRLVRRSKSLTLLHSTATCLGLHACRRRTADRGQSTGRYGGTGEQHTSLEHWRGGEPAALASRRWGTSPHKCRGRRRTARPSRQGARRAGGTLERGRAAFQPVNATLTACFSKKMNCATKTIDTKVVDETSLYNICKGRPMFFSTV